MLRLERSKETTLECWFPRLCSKAQSSAEPERMPPPRLLGPDLLRFLLGLADHAARNQVPVELQDLPHLDLDSPSPAQAAFQRLRGLFYVQASYRILAAVFEGVTKRIY